ncbi:MAG: DUF1284 domain-containing protein [Peptoniphilus harei]|uniref:DUF1284 domain-containing protein n=1 Tax=Peptoniphilus harei TaxID=54005 RepID=UPI00290B738B|nr:DUF1284 domain-containing protein [Peptoniphilus harei]MDU5471303.1 DUF1284 domain-containing protein [Peptoniphilus harei]MDU6097531.1 DUF1284 domain-containing protein [Peptoniphilus harei]
MLKIRAHHLLCTENFVGEGYSDDFSKNMAKVIGQLKENPKVKLLADLDDICGPCPENRGTRCENDDLVKSYDRKVLEALNLSEGEIYSWDDIRKLACDIIFVRNRREEICGECQWNELCKEVEAKRR